MMKDIDDRQQQRGAVVVAMITRTSRVRRLVHQRDVARVVEHTNSRVGNDDDTVEARIISFDARLTLRASQ
jgi:hypothetical protein